MKIKTFIFEKFSAINDDILNDFIFDKTVYDIDTQIVTVRKNDNGEYDETIIMTRVLYETLDK